MAIAVERPPYRAYAVIVGVFASGLAAAGGLAGLKASRTLARDEVTSFLREPFVHGHAHTCGGRRERLPPGSVRGSYVEG